jgi:phosphomannomutase
MNVDLILSKIQQEYSDHKVNTLDGVKIDFDEGWVHLRKSNTEPIIRIYAEHKNREEADKLADGIKNVILKLTS